MKPESVTIARWVLVGMASATAWVSQAQPHWPQFRGPNSQGVVETATPPVHFHASSNLVWSAAIPPGHCSPCIWGPRIFLTAFADGKLETHAYDRLSGKPLWRQAAPAVEIEKTQPFNNPPHQPRWLTPSACWRISVPTACSVTTTPADASTWPLIPAPWLSSMPALTH